jgi:hypothetical protein
MSGEQRRKEGTKRQGLGRVFHSVKEESRSKQISPHSFPFQRRTEAHSVSDCGIQARENTAKLKVQIHSTSLPCTADRASHTEGSGLQPEPGYTHSLVHE